MLSDIEKKAAQLNMVKNLKRACSEVEKYKEKIIEIYSKNLYITKDDIKLPDVDKLLKNLYIKYAKLNLKLENENDKSYI